MYFAGVMVRLMLTLTPVVCILAAIAFSVTLDNYLVDDRPSENKESEAASAEVESSSEENDKKKRKDLYDKVCASLLCSHFLGCHATLPPKKRLLATEPHSMKGMSMKGMLFGCDHPFLLGERCVTSQ